MVARTGHREQTSGRSGSVLANAREVWRQIGEDDCLDLAARVSYYFVLALFPTFIILAALVSYLPINHAWSSVVHWTAQYFPQSSRGALVDTLKHLSRGRGGFLSFGVASAAWAASTGIVSLMGALNVIHGIRNSRGFIRQRAVALGMLAVLCFCFLLAFALQSSAGAVASELQKQMNTGSFVPMLWRVGAWVLSIMLLALGISLVETVLPNTPRRWRWLTAGGIFFVVVSIPASIGFRFYVRNFNSYSAYGVFGALFVLMLWIYIESLFILIAGEIDSVLMHSWSAVPAEANAAENPPAA